VRKFATNKKLRITVNTITEIQSSNEFVHTLTPLQRTEWHRPAGSWMHRCSYAGDWWWIEVYIGWCGCMI